MLLTLGTFILGNVTVILPAEARVRGSEMTLGEIATVQGDNPQQVERVKGLALGYAPTPGFSRVLQGWKIEQKLKRDLGDLECEIAGRTACRVWPSVAIIPGKEIESEARSALVAIFAGKDVEIRAGDSLEDERVPVGIQARELVARPTTTEPRPGPWSVPVKILIDGMPYRTVWTTFQVDLYSVLPVLGRDIAPGETITAKDIVMQRAVIAAGGKPALKSKALVGAKAKRLLKAGTPVLGRDVDRLLAVEKGEKVTLVVRNGRVSASTEVVALENGYLGDEIGVLTENSARELRVRVVGIGRLELHIQSSK